MPRQSPVRRTYTKTLGVLRKNELLQLAAELGLPTDGSVVVLRDRVKVHLTAINETLYRNPRYKALYPKLHQHFHLVIHLLLHHTRPGTVLSTINYLPDLLHPISPPPSPPSVPGSIHGFPLLDYYRPDGCKLALVIFLLISPLHKFLFLTSYLVAFG